MSYTWWPNNHYCKLLSRVRLLKTRSQGLSYPASCHKERPPSMSAVELRPCLESTTTRKGRSISVLASYLLGMSQIVGESVEDLSNHLVKSKVLLWWFLDMVYRKFQDESL